MSMRREEIMQAMAEYHPCENGLHVMHPFGDPERPFTFINIPLSSADEAQRIWELCKAQFEAAENEPHDFLVDLNKWDANAWSHYDDFWITRQMIEPMRKFVEATP